MSEIGSPVIERTRLARPSSERPDGTVEATKAVPPYSRLGRLSTFPEDPLVVFGNGCLSSDSVFDGRYRRVTPEGVYRHVRIR
jgi:hypothetical protein